VKEILKLIETVDPDDSAALNEIDLAVHDYVSDPRISYLNAGRPKYTRSRDALKTIRPDGYWSCGAPSDTNRYNTEPHDMVNGYSGICTDNKMSFETTVDYDPFPTEELAELHAIIQAIEWERNND